MIREPMRTATLLVMTLLLSCSEPTQVEPVPVTPPDGETTVTAAPDTETRADTPRVARRPVDDSQDDDTPTTDQPDIIRPSRPGADEVAGGGVWVVDSAGQDVGALVRRGSDDNLVYRAIYDLVTVYHPTSGILFEITMTDAVVRRPSTTFFSTADCQGPIGISYGGCSECRSGPGTALLHDGTWYRVTPGITFEVVTSGATIGSGMESACSSHHTDSAKVFPVSELNGPTPPTTFTPPLHFAWK